MNGLTRSPIVWGVIIVIFAVCTSQNVYAIDNQSQWDAAFQRLYSNQDPLLNDPGLNPSEVFAWRGHYWVRAYVSMAWTTGDTKYLDKAIRLIEYMLSYRDDARQVRGEIDIQQEPYDQAPSYYLNHRNEAAPSWRRFDPVIGWRVLVVIDGQITHAIMRFVDLVHSDSRFIAYRSKTDEYIRKVEETVRAHDETFVFNQNEDMPGSYFYPDPDGGLYSGGVEYNMNATMGVTLLLLDKVKNGMPAYRQKAEACLDYFKKNVRLTNNNAYDWNYHLVRSDIISSGDQSNEDFNHGHMDISFLVMSYHRGLAINNEDMQRLANAFTKNIYLGDGNLSQYVNGSGTINSYGAVGFEAAYDWIDLAEIDAAAFTIAREVYEKHYPNPTWARPFFGWAEILRWAKILNNSARPEPPQNLRIVNVLAN